MAKAMEQYVKSISRRVEFGIVVVVAFGLSIFTSIAIIFAPGTNAPIYEAGLQFLLIYEALVIVVSGGFLAMRGWGLCQPGFVFAYWFARTGRLWRVVIAHAFSILQRL